MIKMGHISAIKYWPLTTNEITRDFISVHSENYNKTIQYIIVGILQTSYWFLKLGSRKSRTIKNNNYRNDKVL